MPDSRPAIFGDWIANAVAGSAVVLVLGMFLLWTRSYAGIGDELSAELAGNRLHVISRGGRVIVGVLESNPLTLFRWRRVRTTDINGLVADPEQFIVADTFGWGVAIPYWVLCGLAAVTPIWLWIVRRDRAEFVRRQALGLCRHCGYDLRASPLRCPECGAPSRRAATRAALHDDPDTAEAT